MEIYYINSENFLKTHDTDFLKKFAGEKEFKSMKRFVQHSLGRYLVKTVAEQVYAVVNTEILIENDKPKFKNSSLNFSISHSGKYIVVAFDEEECGLDIEEMKTRELEPLSKRYEKEFLTLEDFYKFWTNYEAEIKLQQPAKWSHSEVFQTDFMLTAVSATADNVVVISEIE